MALDFLLGCFGWRPSRMPKANEATTQVWLRTLKAVFILPLGITAFECRKVYNTVKHIPEVRHPPYHEHIMLAHLLTYIGSMSIFAWLFVSFGLLMFSQVSWKGPYILMLGLVDLGLALTLAIGVGLQTQYLPSTSGRCSKATTWQTSNMEDSFFTVLAKDDWPSSAGSKCQWLVSAWSQAVASLSFQLLVTYVGVFFDEREHSMLNPFRPLVYLFVAIFAPPFWIHNHITPRLRFAWRYLSKLSRLSREKDLVFETPIPYTPKSEHIAISYSKLQEILTIEHVLLNLVDNLHYEDVISLSLTCKAVREAVFPHRDQDYRVPKLKNRVCDEASKKPCLYCNKKICFECKATRFLPGLPGRRHVATCQPYCANCYFKHFSRHTRGFKKPCRVCTVTDKALEFQQMCRTCCDKDPAGLREKRFLRYQQEARNIAEGKGLLSGEKVKCGRCKEELKSGARWWVCGKCKGECRDAIHPPFAMKRKVVDAEKAEELERKVEEMESSKWSKCMALLRHHRT